MALLGVTSAQPYESATLKQIDQALTAQLKGQDPELILTDSSGSLSIRLPQPLYSVLARVSRELAKGKTVVVMAMDQELTTQQAAELLNVSRPHFVKLLEQGALPFHRVGTHRRVFLRDLIAYKEKRDQECESALAELISLSEEAGLYDNPTASDT